MSLIWIEVLNSSPDIIKRLRDTGLFACSKHGEPNHIIVNEYEPGQGIMPHEDGPSYHPVVATLSLGSHAVFNYHRYLEDPQISLSVPRSTPDSETSGGKTIDPKPILSVLLEPRSLVITVKALYTHHLHAIEPLERDVLLPAQIERTPRDQDLGHSGGITIANWKMLRGEEESRVAREGGVIARKTRVSLTCRDVGRVMGGKGLRAFSKR
ncbi:hypothetical protein K439DRAFT_1643458 [Ramaria rubella]|nr:hypothetical protein K439DRAFT_1643458 [Ramaria rubella]